MYHITKKKLSSVSIVRIKFCNGVNLEMSMVFTFYSCYFMISGTHELPVLLHGSQVESRLENILTYLKNQVSLSLWQLKKYFLVFWKVEGHFQTLIFKLFIFINIQGYTRWAIQLVQIWLSQDMVIHLVWFQMEIILLNIHIHVCIIQYMYVDMFYLFC